MGGLTYPLANILLPLSNHLVHLARSNKLNPSTSDRTKHSGHRGVYFKTNSPKILSLLLNRWSMIPLHWIQKSFINSEKALVIYFEVNIKHRIFSNGI